MVSRRSRRPALPPHRPAATYRNRTRRGDHPVESRACRGLPPGALAGAGYFAHLPLDDEVWLPLARASAEHTPPDSPDTAAERAATHPDSQDARVLTALLVAWPTDTWAAHTVLPHAHALFRDAVRADGHAYSDAVARLREALINAGELDLARPPTEFG